MYILDFRIVVTFHRKYLILLHVSPWLKHVAQPKYERAHECFISTQLLKGNAKTEETAWIPSKNVQLIVYFEQGARACDAYWGCQELCLNFCPAILGCEPGK